MARQESEREDLLRDATALVQRVELQLTGFQEAVVIGFRRDGACSIYIGQDEVYQFNSLGHLRRGYTAGRLIKAVGGGLAELQRQRQPEAVELVRHDLDEGQTAEYLQRLETRLSEIRARLQTDGYDITGQVPAEADIIGRCRDWLESQAGGITIAKAPGVMSPRSK